VQESLPESLDLKRALYRELHPHLRTATPLASSTSGFKPSDLAAELPFARQLLVCHPFNPVYLLPAVEVVGSRDTKADVLERSMDILRSVSMHPVHIRAEIDAHVADRLLEALWREALWLVKDGIATTEEIDNIMRYGFGLRWAQMGLFETYRIGGGEAGIHHFLEQFGPALAWPWSRLTDVPDMDEALVNTIAKQSDAQSGHLSIAQLEDQRDQNLVAIMRALRKTNHGAGRIINDYLSHNLGGE
jgi:carnitine 3-dehydrogenase